MPLAAGGEDRRNDEAETILLKQALKISPDLPQEQTLKSILDVFKGRNESGLLDTEEPIEPKRIEPIIEVLSGRVSKDNIVECCKN